MGRDARADNPRGFATAREVEGPSPEGRQVVEDLVLFPPVNKIRGRSRQSLKPELKSWIAAPDQYEFSGGLIGQRAQQNGIDDAEERRVGANTQGQNEQREAGESGAPRVLTKAITNILPQRSH